MPSRRQILRHAAAGLAVTLVPLPSALRAEASVLRSGRFAGASGHTTTGTGAIVAEDGRHAVALGEDFRFDGAPDPRVALGRDGYDADTLLGPLLRTAGAQSYPIPDRIDPAAYNEIWIWCERFSVPLGVARLA